MTDAPSTSTPLHTGSHPLRLPALVGALVVPAALLLGGCGDSGDDPVAADTTSASPSASSTAPSTSPSTSTSTSPSGSASATDTAQPAIDPVVAKAVAPALKKGYPALVSAGLPSGWSVQSAQFTTQGGGSWTMVLTDETGATVELDQSSASLADQVSGAVGAGAKATGTVDLGVLGSWKAWTGGSAPAIGTELSDSSVVVHGSDQDHLVALGQTLLTAEDSDMPDAG